MSFGEKKNSKFNAILVLFCQVKSITIVRQSCGKKNIHGFETLPTVKWEFKL